MKSELYEHIVANLTKHCIFKKIFRQKKIQPVN